MGYNQSMSDLSFFEQNGWRIADVLHTAERRAETVDIADLSLGPKTRAFLGKAYPGGIYRHQKAALVYALAGKAVCLTTGTASGKSLVFQVAALDRLERDPGATIMAIYPMKALSNEQRDRWEHVLHDAGSDVVVGRIDGNVPPAMRASILERSRVVVFTPDILHAWVFSNLNNSAVQKFLAHTAMVIVDEVHAYNGVFGSNSAFLFRRLQHLQALLGSRPSYICASATIAHPGEHLESLFGIDFDLVGSELDSSPRHPLEVVLVEPPAKTGTLESVVSFLDYLANHTQSRFLTFVDSRKQVELISSILARSRREAEEKEKEKEKEPEKPKPKSKAKEKIVEDEPIDDGPEKHYSSVLDGLNVLPYRAGYEENDRQFIQEKLSDGSLNGVVSTSALELGIDIPHLDTCVLIGVPSSATSLQQRIGRIGRHAAGQVFVVNAGDVYDRAVFANPPSFFHRPLAESALYLGNRYIQYIHALCLARQGGEHSQVLQSMRKTDSEFRSVVRWPANFIELCRSERSGATPRDLIGMKNEGKERPNYTFPLREVEGQFKVERYQGPTPASLGSLSFGQLMREAYPGAVYYYATTPYRVTRVNLKARQIQVRREKRYTTRPNRLPDRAFPRLNPDGLFSAWGMGQLFEGECQLMVRESISGVIEQRGGIENVYPYPLPRELGFIQDQPYFTRNFFTTGIVISHPALAAPGVYAPALAELLYEAFMLLIPYDRQDIGWAGDFFRQTRPPLVQEGQPFLTIFDQTYGSLRLSARLLEPGVLGRVLLEASLLAGELEHPQLNPATRTALIEMAVAALTAGPQELAFSQSEAPVPAGWERVVMPESKGLLLRSNEEFRVVRLMQTPMGPCYEGVPASLSANVATTVMPYLIDVAEIPGESQMGLYDPATGVLEVLPEAGFKLGYALLEDGRPHAALAFDLELAAERLSSHRDIAKLLKLTSRLGLTQLALEINESRAGLAQKIVEKTNLFSLLLALVENDVEGA